MKRLMISTLSALVLSSVATPVFAGEMAAISDGKHHVQEITPINLVVLADRGFFRDQGIPSGFSLIHAVKTGRIDARNLVEVAIANNRLTPDTLNDTGYLSVVQMELEDLDRSS